MAMQCVCMPQCTAAACVSIYIGRQRQRARAHPGPPVGANASAHAPSRATTAHRQGWPSSPSRATARRGPLAPAARVRGPCTWQGRLRSAQVHPAAPPCSCRGAATATPPPLPMRGIQRRPCPPPSDAGRRAVGGPAWCWGAAVLVCQASLAKSCRRSLLCSRERCPGRCRARAAHNSGCCPATRGAVWTGKTAWSAAPGVGVTGAPQSRRASRHAARGWRVTAGRRSPHPPCPWHT